MYSIFILFYLQRIYNVSFSYYIMAKFLSPSFLFFLVSYYRPIDLDPSEEGCKSGPWIAVSSYHIAPKLIPRDACKDQ